MRVFRTIALLVVAVAGALAALVAWPLLRAPRQPGDRPVVALSLDKSWFNRLGLNRTTYRRAILRAGGFPRLLDFDDAGLEEVEPARVRRLLSGVHGLILSGGGDVDPNLYGGDSRVGQSVKPMRDRFELALLAEAQRRGMPILAICRGTQLVNVARGGTLVNVRSDPELERRHRSLRSHAVALEPDSRLAELLGTRDVGRVVSWHGQAVAEPGDGVRVVGRASDGVVEAIEVVAADAPWIMGVQWHPEVSRRDEVQARLFEAFLAAAESYRAGAADAP